MIISQKNWRKILTRPFSLLGASIWNEWYASDTTKEILGLNVANGLFIEHPRGVVSHYREIEDFKALKSFLRKEFSKNPRKYELLLKEGSRLNKKAGFALKKNPFKAAKEAVNFLTRLAILSTILPYIIGELIGNKRFIKRMMIYSMMLRGISLYPKVINKIVEPLVIKELRESRIKEKGSHHLITYNELLKKDFSQIKKRISKVRDNKKFIYQNFAGKESITWTKVPEEIIRQVENLKKSSKTVLRGSIAYKGRAIGKARLILTNELKNVEFNEGDILIAPSTNPALVPLMKKAGAIVTDEGGIMSHAAIISRELKNPCIIGTKNASKVIKEDQEVEVDAENGVVRIVT